MLRTVICFIFLFTNNHSDGFNFNLFRQIAHKPHVYCNPNSDAKIYIIDIDGTICSKTKSEYNNCEPIYENIQVFNELYMKGNQIHYWTARGANSGKNWDHLTIKQLDEWHVHYCSINMGKPHYDVWIDDKAHNADIFCNPNKSYFDDNNK
tara:strand:+ start:5055 stop:5507 length:453 start_codon:yes stop_codon:yes gene_type:complete